MADKAIEIGGTVEPGFGPVADAFRANFDERDEVGAACAVMVDNKLVVDLWGGHRDKARSSPWQQDTVVTMFSTTKGMAAASMAIAHSRGWFGLDQPVATYWPEFAANGKEHITVAQLLGHQAGLAVIDTALTPEILGDFDQLGTILAAQQPGWEPGTDQGYHAQSLGWYESQLLSRVDPQRRTIGQFFASEIAEVLGIEFYIGLPAELQADRRATFLAASKLVLAVHARETPWPLLRRMMNPFSDTFKAFSNPKALLKAQDINKPVLLDIELPSVNGTGTARAVATVYGDLASGGQRLGVTAETLACIEQSVAPKTDRIFGIESAFSFGFMKQFPMLPFGTSSRAYGHTGVGGSFGYADPDKKLGYCYAMNRPGYSVPTDPREIALRTAVDTCTTIAS